MENNFEKVRYLERILLENGNAEEKLKMEKYMRNMFIFAGVKAPKRRELTAPIINEIAKESNEINWEFINLCWESQYREMQSVATDYIKKVEKRFTYADIKPLKKLIITKSWWDSVDQMDTVFGIICKKDKKAIKIMISWSKSKNIWLRRIAIDHQLGLRENTDLERLNIILLNNLNQSEFFINKAMGWALRDLSKTNPTFVANFIKTNKDNLANLTIKEASKYL